MSGIADQSKSSRLCYSVFGNASSKKSEIDVYISQGGCLPIGSFLLYRPDIHRWYEPFNDDFGPISISFSLQFISVLDNQLSRCLLTGCDSLVLSVEDGPRTLTNAAFLVGCYMVMKLDMSLDQIMNCFAKLESHLIEDCRDASNSSPDFGLTLTDCWGALQRGVHAGG